MINTKLLKQFNESLKIDYEFLERPEIQDMMISKCKCKNLQVECLIDYAVIDVLDYIISF